MPTVTIHRPDVFTKELRLQANAASGQRWLRISSNLLPAMGFEYGARFERRVLAPGAGFEFRLNQNGPTSVYRRTYNRRNNRPFETVIDFKSQQSFIDAAIPRFAERVHLTFRPGVIIGRPVAERTFYIRKAISEPTVPLEAFVALSSGIDAALLRKAGFGMQALLEYRPRERRDTTDLSETGIVTALANNDFRFVFNEDIYRVDFARVREALIGQPPPALLAISPQCDDHSLAKAPSAKLRAVENLDTTVDMVYEVLRLIETINPGVIHCENVPGFLTSSAGELLILKLRRWGYFITSGVYDARGYGGATGRKRCYIVASVYPGFVAPEASAEPAEPGRVWPLVVDQLTECRDATHTRSLQEGIATGRARLITSQSTHAPTILKSQGRHTKDSIYIKTDDGRYLLPNEAILRRLQGIPADFTFDGVGQEIAVEQIGQSVCGHMHHAFAVAIKKHLDEYRQGEPLTAAHVQTRATPAESTPPAPAGAQTLLAL